MPIGGNTSTATASTTQSDPLIPRCNQYLCLIACFRAIDKNVANLEFDHDNQGYTNYMFFDSRVVVTLRGSPAGSFIYFQFERRVS